MEMYFLLDQVDGDAVVMLVQTHIAIHLHSGDRPLHNLETDGIQGAHTGTLDLLILLPAAVVPTREIRVVMDFQRHSYGSVKSL